MHDIDRTQLEYSPELEDYEYEQYEQFEYGDNEWNEETGVFSEAEAIELASELLGVDSEEELDQFLGNLIKKAGKAVGQFVKSPVGQQLGGLLKGAAKKALPMVGSAIGGYFGGDTGAKLGSQAASTAGRIFGLELEGLSQEDQEFEAAKSFVQFAGAAAKNAASAAPTANPKAIAQQAATAAARQLAPGLLAGAMGGAHKKPAPTDKPCPACGRGQRGGRSASGRWYRRGNKIVLLGA